MEIKILAFGQIKEIVGKTTFSIANIYTTDELKNQLINQFPEINNINYSLAINKNIIQINTELQNGDNVALLPPFSGG